MGTIPALPADFAALTRLPASQLNALKVVSAFWASPPRCRVYASAATAVPSTTGATTTIAFGAETYDVVQAGDTGMHDNVAGNTAVWIRTAGVYRVSAQATFDANATGHRVAKVLLNGVTVLAQGIAPALTTGGLTACPVPSDAYPLNAGDRIELVVQQNSGATINVIAGSAETFLSLRLETTLP